MRLASGIIRILLLLPIAAHSMPVMGGADRQEQCRTAKQRLYFRSDARLDSVAYAEFSRQLFDDLVLPVQEIGYCLTAADSVALPRDSARLTDDPALFATARPVPGSVTQSELIVGVLTMKELAVEGPDRAMARPLVSLVYTPDDLAGLRAILVRKIIENLRTQYICYLSISTDPPGVDMQTSGGLADRTPVSWVLPVGDVRVQGRLKRFLPLDKEISLPRPGVYHYDFQMNRRQFYHSGFIWPAAVFALSAGVCYAIERVNYDSYLSLGQTDNRDRPGQFGRTFNTAQTFEWLSIASAVLSALSLALSFRL